MTPDEVAKQMIFQEHSITLCQYVSSRANGFTKVAEEPLSWRNFADYSVDELFPISSIGRLPEARENRFSTEERAKFTSRDSVIITPC
jgi:hypothetical protein